MVDWKIYIDSPQQRAIKLCHGSLTEGEGLGDGWGSDFGAGYGDGYGYGYGGSSTEW